MPPQELELDMLLRTTLLLLLIPTAAAKLNVLENPSFEHKGHWDLRERPSSWEVRLATEAVRISKDNAHKGYSSLLLTPPRDYDLQAVWASQYVQMQNATVVGPASLKISFHVFSEDFKHLRAIVAISYTNGHHMVVDLDAEEFAVGSSEDDEDDFTEVCSFVPAYGQIRALMLHFILDREARSPIYVDSVRVLRNQEKGKFCGLYVKSFPQKRQTIPNFLTPTEQHVKTGITVATQLTVDRWPQLEVLAKRWQGPVSVALLLFQGEIKDNRVQDLVKSYHQSNMLQKFVSIHLVFEDELNGEDSVRYPANYLRNVALSNARTSHMFCLDADTLPIFSESVAFDSMARAIESIGGDANEAMWTFIAPAFYSKNPKATSFPETKKELLWQLKDGTSFQQMPAISHSAVKYTRWKANHRAYEVPYQENMEPYFIVSRDSPLLNDMFVGYGQDRCAYAKELSKAGYRFAVLPEVYLINMRESESSDTTLNRANSQAAKGLVDINVFLTAAFHEKDMEHGYFGYQQNNRLEALGLGSSETDETTLPNCFGDLKNCAERHKYARDSQHIHSAATETSQKAGSDAGGSKSQELNSNGEL